MAADWGDDCPGEVALGSSVVAVVDWASFVAVLVGSHDSVRCGGVRSCLCSCGGNKRRGWGESLFLCSRLEEDFVIDTFVV